MPLVLRLPREMRLGGSSSNAPRLPSFLEFPVLFGRVHNLLRLPRETTSERLKVVRARQFSTLLTSKCASRYTGVHFLNI